MSETTQATIGTPRPTGDGATTPRGGITAPRRWLGWFVAVLWAVVAVLLLQNAVASVQELEPRAGTILWVVLAVWVVAGAVIAVLRRVRR